MNEVVKNPKKEVALTKGQKFQVELVNELEKSASLMGQDYTPYGKQCVINAVAGLVAYCRQNSVSLSDIDPIMMRLSLQNVGYVELNYAAIPSEVYFDIRKIKVKVKNENNEETEKEMIQATIKPQGAGNEVLVRKYGVGVKEKTGLHSAILIREGDKFVMPIYNGLTITPPVYEPKLENANNKVIALMYIVEKVDGSVEYLITTREGIKPNLIALVRQNALYKFKKEVVGKNGKKYYEIDYEKRDAFYQEVNEEFAKLSVDEILNDQRWSDYINPTYTSGGSKEQMVIRKMKNNALKNYPKEYDNAFMREAVENMFEDSDETVTEKAPVYREENVVATVEREISEKPSDANAPQDFKVDVNGEVVKQDVGVLTEPVEEKQEEQEPKKNDYDSML